MTAFKKSLVFLLTAALIANLLFVTGCNQQKKSNTEAKKEPGESRMFLASFALIDLTGDINSTPVGASNRYKENLSRILPQQKSTLDSAVFYSAALELDSAMQLLARIDKKSLTDSLAAVYYVLLANGDRVLNGNHALALSHIDSALALNSRNPRALNAKSAILNDLGKFPEALAALDSAWSLDSSNIKTRWYRAMIIAKMGRAEEALASIEPDLQKSPDENRYFVLNLKGWLLCILNRCDEAIAYHDSALALNPKHYFGYLDKAIALYKLERYKDMVETLDEADALVPNQVWVKYNKACCYAKMKNRDATLAALGDAIATDSTAKLMAGQDPDFKLYENDPDFKKLVGK
jgi:tetratricopeptide (TPR) repeat protein